MIAAVSQVAVPVADKERARAFWTEKVGFEVHTDERYGEERWIEIAPPNGPLLILDSPSAAEAGQPDRANLLDSRILFTCDDIERTHRELAERGVHFSAMPQQMLFGWWAVFEDDEGMRYGLGETGPEGLEAFLAGKQPGSGAAALDVLVGSWRTRGTTIEGPSGPAARINALDTYEWLPGRHALLHCVDARVGDQKIEGAEIIGYDAARRAYRSQYFGSEGPTTYDATLTEVDGRLLWKMQSGGTRFAGTFGEGGDTITGHWELLREGNWLPWMDITLTKEGAG